MATTDAPLATGKTKKQRKELAEQSGIEKGKLLKFINMVDLFRIKGVGSEYAKLLEATGIDTVPELAQHKAENLCAQMEEVSAEKALVRCTPPLKTVEDWVAQAKELPRTIEY